MFTLGVGRDADDARTLVRRFRGAGAAQGALEAVWQHWKHTLGAVNVQTPDPSVNVLVNGWLANASTNYARYNYSNAFVITDVALARCHATSPTGGAWNGCGHQEQLTFTGPLTVTTPEPASMVLLATGLIALTVTSRRRRKS